MADRLNSAGDRRSLLPVAVAVALVGVAAVAPSLVGARPANEIPVTEVSDANASVTTPTGDAWGDAPAKDVALASAESGAPNADDTTAESVAVRAIRTDDRLFLRLSWADPSTDATLNDNQTVAPEVNAFADAAAVQLPANASANPGIAMGSERTPVNVWYWNAESGGQSLLAGGPGTTTRTEATVRTNATHDGDRWHVVLARNASVDGQNQTALDVEEDVRVAFAVWNGNNSERAGQKAVSEWQYFPFGPGPQGPPYEAILWAIAGLAVVAVLVATAVGVRQAGGEQ